jgi:hypothetical protein
MRPVQAAVIIIITVIFIFGAGGNTNAAVIDSEDYFLDTNTGWYWYSRVGEFANQDWETAQDNIDNLTKGGMIWELASASDIQTLGRYYIPDALLLNGMMPFTTPNKSIWGWLSDEGSTPGSKAVARLSAKKATPQLDSRPELNKHPWVGAFAVAKPGNTSHPTP